MEFDVKLNIHGRGLKSCKCQNGFRILNSYKLNLQQFQWCKKMFDSDPYEILIDVKYY